MDACDEPDGGFAMLEVVVALTLITVIMAAVGAEFLGAMISTTMQRAKQAAVQVADAEVEYLRSLHASDLLLGRSSASVAAQFSSAPTAVQPWLTSMTRGFDTSWTTGKPVTVPTAGTAQRPSSTSFTVTDYLGWCAIATGTAVCTATGSNSGAYLRAVVAVTWSASSCKPAPCAFVTTTLISAAADPTFQSNQPLPAAPVATPPGNQIVAVNDIVSLQLTVQGSTGVPPFTWAVTAGSLPAGLGMSPTGLISGPVGGSAGSYSTTVQVTDAFLRTASRTFNWTVEPPLAIGAVSPQASVTGSPITPLTLTATGGDGSPYTWSDPSGTLPPGLALSSSGTISGTPTTVGTYTVRPKLVDKGGVRTVTGSFTWTISYPPIAASNPGTQTSTITRAISTLTLSASGGDGRYAWSDPTGSLPAGLSISSSGQVTGTPTLVKSSTVSLTVSDPTAGPSYTTSVSFTWSVVAKPTITAPAAQASSIGTSVNVQVTTTCPNSPCTYSLNSGPSGLSVNSTGRITGTVNGTVKTYTGVTVTVTDAAGATATTAGFNWTVNATPAITSPGAQTSASATAVSLDMSAQVTGGTGSRTYSATGLPTGLSITSSTGVISGSTQNVSGTSTNAVTVTVTDSTGVSATTASFNWYVTSLRITIGNQSSDRATAVNLDLNSYTTGGNNPYTFSASALPAGLSLNGVTGKITGKATANGTTTVRITVVDNKGASLTSAAFTWTVSTNPLALATIPNQSTARKASDTLNIASFVTGGNSPYTFSATNLPSWLTINSSTGVITGTAPNSKATYSNIKVTVTDSDGTVKTSNAFTWTVT